VQGRSVAINLASTPFENRRPVSRVKWLLVVFGVLVWSLVAVKFWDYAAGSSEETRGQLEAVEAQIAAINEQLNQAERRLRDSDIEARNARTEFLNAKLAERSFPWSQLFRDLAAAQPYAVRLQRVTPKVAEPDGDRGPSLLADLSLDGTAQKRDNWYRFVDKLFAHERFVAPQMMSENESEDGTDFRLVVSYRMPAQKVTAEGAGR